MLSLPEVRVQSLIEELTLHKPCISVKKKRYRDNDISSLNISGYVSENKDTAVHDHSIIRPDKRNPTSLLMLL